MGRHTLWRRWVLLVTLGEVVGFTVPAAVGAWTLELTPQRQLVLMTCAGLVEGALLGAAQAAVLRRELPGFAPRVWVVATSIGAALAWLLGMLPSTTHDRWSTWPDALVVGAGLLGGALLLATIGTLQATVLPTGTTHRWSWVGWTALGWCVGLMAFSLVAPPLWHVGQPLAARLVIGLAGGVAMAAVMAATTGAGAVRLVERSLTSGHGSGRHMVSSVIGSPAYDAGGRRIGEIADLVVELGADLARVPVTHVVVRARRRHVLVPWRAGTWQRVRAGWQLTGTPLADPRPGLAPTQLLVRQDVLDAPAITVDPPTRARVSDVVVELGPTGAVVLGLDLSPRGAVRRLLGRPTVPHDRPPVPLSAVHLGSKRGHAAQLATPSSLVHLPSADAVAQILTRAPVHHARDIVGIADRTIAEHALRLLHPQVRDRVTGQDPPPRRTRRLGGWRLHRPNRSDGHQGGAA